METGKVVGIDTKELDNELKEYKKALKLAKSKLDYFTRSELENFIKNYVADTMYPQLNETSTNTIDDSYDNLKTCLDYRILGYNNAYLGDKSKGGERYKRCILTLVNSELAPREMQIKLKWLVPSGFGDGDAKFGSLNESYILTDHDIIQIKKLGSARDYLKEILSIPDELESKNEKPYRLPNVIKPTKQTKPIKVIKPINQNTKK